MTHYSKIIDTGVKFGRWTVLSLDTDKNTKCRYYRCVCCCGKTNSVRGTSLIQGKSLSCGCLAIEKSSGPKLDKRNGNLAKVRGTLEYFKCQTWGNIKRRTVNSKEFINFDRFKTYKNKGIELRMSKQEFYAWVDFVWPQIEALYQLGLTPSIDRIDNDGHYQLDNIQILELRENIAKDHDYVATIKAATAAKCKKIKLVHPDGKVEYFASIKEACLVNDLAPAKLSSVLTKSRQHHKGFKAYYMDSP